MRRPSIDTLVRYGYLPPHYSPAKTRLTSVRVAHFSTAYAGKHRSES